MTVATVDPNGKESVADHQSSMNDDENDTLLFGKLEEYILTHYPNPERIGCPDPAILKKFAESPHEVGLADLKNLHIFKCAECTRTLMELREQREHARILDDPQPALPPANTH